MKIVKNELRHINNEVEIFIIGDTHIGSSQFNEPLLVDLIKYILERENRYVILNGDICDCTYVDSKGNVYENAMTPSVALAYACNLLKPLVDANRIICTTGGNHDDDRSMRLVGISIAQQLATLLGIPELYTPDSAMIFAKVRERKGHSAEYHIFVNHGNNGGGSTMGSKANALEKMALVCPTADIYIHSHTHAPMTFKDEYVDISNGSLVWKERLFVNGNAFMKYFNGYGEKKLLKPQSQSIPVIHLRTVRKSLDNGRIDRLVKTMSCEL